MDFMKFPFVAKVRDKFVEYLYKRIMSDYLHEDYPINKINTEYSERKLIISMNNVVLDENLLNRKLSNTYYLEEQFLIDERFIEENNLNLPVVFTNHPTIGNIKITCPLFDLLELNSKVEIDDVKVYLKFNFLSDLMIEHVETDLKEKFRNLLMSSSIQIAEDFITNSKNNSEDFDVSDKIKSYEGYEALSDLIRRLLGRIEFVLNNVSLIFVDNGRKKVEIRLNRIEIINELKKKDEEELKKELEEKDENEEVRESIIKKVAIEGIEFYVDNNLVSKTTTRQTIAHDINENIIDITFSSILNFVLNPRQMNTIIKVFTNKANEKKLPKNRKKKSQYQDKKVSQEEMIKVKQYLEREKEKEKLSKNLNASNKLSLNKLNQLWSTGFGNNETKSEDLKFYEFETKKNKKKSKEKEEKNLRLNITIPGIAICILNKNENVHDVFEIGKLNDLLEINQKLKTAYFNQDCLTLILLENNLTLENLCKIEVTNIMFSEIYNGINEHIIFNNVIKSLESITLEIDFIKNDFYIHSKKDILINIDLTLIERLYTYFDLRTYFESKKSLMLNPTVLKVKEKTFNLSFDLKNVSGTIFFPIPNLTKDLVRKISDIHDDVIQFNSPNLVVKANPNEIKVYSDYIEFYLIDNFVPYRRDHNKNENIELSSSKICELRSNNIDNIDNLVELVLSFKPDVNGSILIDGNLPKKNSEQLSSNNQTSNLEDSVYVKNIYNLDSESFSPFKTKKRKIIKEDDFKESEMILPNDKKKSISYLNGAAKVSKMNILLNVPQALILLSDKEQLNLIYNRLANDLLLWTPFNGAKDDKINDYFTNQDENDEELSKNLLKCKLLDSDGNFVEMEDDFANFDANVLNFSNLLKSKNPSDSMLESFIQDSYSSNPAMPNEFLFNSNTVDNMTTSFKLCKSGLEESSESEALYHSLSYSTINPIYSLENETTFVMSINEMVLHFEHTIKKDDFEKASKKYDKNSENSNLHDFFDNFQIVENQSIVGKRLLIGCVAKMIKDNSTRVFIHGEDVHFKMNNLSPVNKLQESCVHNNQFPMIGNNKLVSKNGNCKLNLGIEIIREEVNLKKIKIAVQLIDSLILQLNIKEILKFWNFVNVVDDNIEGYVPPKILTELHINLSNAALILEPECFCNNFNNPYNSSNSLNKNNQTGGVLKNSSKSNKKSCSICDNLDSLENRPGLLILDDASIICLIMENSSEVMLKFNFEESSLFLAKKLPNYSQKIEAHLKNYNNSIKEAYYSMNKLSLYNYVCNVSCGLLDLNLTLNNGDLQEIKLNNDLINFTCCNDSLASLILIIKKYLLSTDTPSSTIVDENQELETEIKKQPEVRTRESVKKNLFGCKNDNLLNTSSTNTKSFGYEPRKKSPSPIYDPSFLEDNEEDAKLNAANRVRVCKPIEKPPLESSFYILGYDDFGTGIKNTNNFEPEHVVLSEGFEEMIENYIPVPQIASVPPFCPKKTLFRFLLEEMSVNFNIFGGSDFFEKSSNNESTNENQDENLDDFYTENLTRRSSISSSSNGTTKPPIRQTTVRFSENVQQSKPELSVANERTYDKSNNFYADLSKFDYLAANFGQKLFISKKQVIKEFFSIIESLNQSDFRCKSLNKEDVLWEELDLVALGSASGDVNFSLRSNANVAIIKKCGGYKRNDKLNVNLQLKKIKCLFEKFNEYQPYSWKTAFACSDIELLDYVKKSRIKKMLYEYVTEKLPQRSQPMLGVRIYSNRNLMCDKKINADGSTEQLERGFGETNVASNIYETTYDKSGITHSVLKKKRRYDPNSSDCDLIISMNPLRINIDQDTIFFLTDFFKDFAIYLEETNDSENSKTKDFNNDNFSDSTSYECGFNQNSNHHFTSNANKKKENIKPPTYIKHFEFSQDVPIKLDYHGKWVDMKSGAIKGILMGLGQLHGSELTLKSFDYRHGILGFEKVLLYAIEFWANDIKKHQLPSILGGVGPANSFIQLFRGIKDLIVMPIDQYRKDKRLVRGLQKGLFSFSTSSTVALIELTNKSLGIIEFAAQFFHDLISGTNPLRRERMLAISYEYKWNQPRDAREGALNAYNVITEGFQQASRNLSMVHGESNSTLSLIRKLPANAFILPILTTQATSNMLIGVRNQMTPQARKEDQDKWKS